MDVSGIPLGGDLRRRQFLAHELVRQLNSGSDESMASNSATRPSHPGEMWDEIEQVVAMNVQERGSAEIEPPAPLPGVTFDPAGGKLFLDGKALSLSRGEKDVLGLLVKEQTATLTTLREVCDRPERVLKRLLKKYPKLRRHISLPGGPARGGYSTTIKPATS